jgi:hypothetical protein
MSLLFMDEYLKEKLGTRMELVLTRRLAGKCSSSSLNEIPNAEIRMTKEGTMTKDENPIRSRGRQTAPTR